MGEISSIQESMALGNVDRSEVILRRLMLVCIAITAGISGIAILGWMLDRLILAGISTNYIPMALSTALLFIVLSSALLIYTRQTVSFHVRMIATVGVFLVILISLIIFIDFFTGMKIDVEQVLQTRPEKFEGVPTGRMSPITAANFLLAGSALLLLLTSPAGRQRARGAAAFLATLEISVGFVILLGYLYGTPLLYGGTIIPVALTTALVFVFLGIGIILAAGKDYWPLSSFMGSSVSASLLRVFLPVTIALVLIHNWLDVVVFKNVVDDVLVSSLMTILSVIILAVIIPRMSHVIGSDIDRANFEKERAIKAMQESESRYRRLFEAAHDGVLLLDADTGKITDVNPFMINILGYSYEEFLGKELWEIGLFKDIVDSKAAFLDLKTKGYVRYEDLPLKTKDGRSIDFEFVSNVYMVNNTKVIQCNIRDITKRKLAEKALIKEKKFTEIALDSQQDTFFIFDPSSKKALRWNKTFRDITGYTDEEIASLKAPNSYYSPEDLEKAASYIESIMRNEKGRVELSLICKDGHKILFEYEASFIRDESGKPKYIISIGRDITEHKRIEEELKKHRDHLEEMVNERTFALAESEEKFKTIFDYSLDGILLVDVATKKFLIGNRMICEMLGFNEEEIKNLSANDIHLEKDLPYVMQQFEKQVRKEIEVAGIPVKRKDGSIFYADIKSIPVTIGGKTYLLGNFRDITGRKHAEESMRLAKEEAEHANNAKTNFLNTMSHELRTPLNAILGFSELMKAKTIGELNEKQEHYLNNIQTGGNNLLNIISQILDFVKMDEGTLELSIEKIPVPETLDEIISVIKEKASKKKVVLEKTIDPKLIHIEADKQKLMQILIYLLDNAVKFSKPEGGHVTLTAQKEGDMAKFSVSDTGIGIKEEEMVSLFEKFTQLDPGLNRRYGGTGLGLAIVKQLVELHGGRIWVKSKYGEGSTFTFSIPLAAKKKLGK